MRDKTAWVEPHIDLAEREAGEIRLAAQADEDTLSGEHDGREGMAKLMREDQQRLYEEPRHERDDDRGLDPILMPSCVCGEREAHRDK